MASAPRTKSHAEGKRFVDLNAASSARVNLSQQSQSQHRATVRPLDHLIWPTARCFDTPPCRTATFLPPSLRPGNLPSASPSSPLQHGSLATWSGRVPSEFARHADGVPSIGTNVLEMDQPFVLGSCHYPFPGLAEPRAPYNGPTGQYDP